MNIVHRANVDGNAKFAIYNLSAIIFYGYCIVSNNSNSKIAETISDG